MSRQTRDEAELAGGGAAANPFSTRHVRPGALPYVFSAGESAATLIARLRGNDWWGQIVGPHGSGKSTLLAALLPELRGAGQEPILITLHDGERSLAGHRETLAAARPGTIVIVDGYEQLAAWNKWRLRRDCRRRGCGLLVTAHAAVGLPPLTTTAVEPSTAAAVLRLLMPRPGPVTDEDLARSLTAHRGDLREALFDLYDLYEMRRERKP